MKNEETILEGLLTVHAKEVEEIFRRAVRQALLEHKKLGHSVAAWRDGKIVIIPPEEIPVDDELHGKQARTQAAKDIEIINQNADRLNEEAMDALSYQVIREVEDEV